MEVSGQPHAPATILPGKEPLVPIGQTGWAPQPAWTRWWRQKFPAFPASRNPHNPAH